MTSDKKVHNIISKISHSTEPRLGEEISVYFDAETGNIGELTVSTIIPFCGMFIMWVVLIAMFGGIIMYALNVNMDKYFAFIKIVGMCFFLPFIMICFEGMLIYAFFYGNEVPFLVKGILVFFVLILGLSIWAYIGLLIKKGTPTWKKTDVGSWSADWEDDEEEKVGETVKKENKNKKMVT